MKFRILIGLFCCFIFFSNESNAQNYTQDAEVISSGGRSSSSGNYTNFSVIGETFVNNSISGSNKELNLGYIYMTKITSKPQGVKEIFGIKSFEIFPNPTSGKFKIRLETTTSLENLDLKVLNGSGKLIYQKQLNHLKGVAEKTISLENEGKGVYFLRMNTDEGAIRKRIVVQ